MKDIHIKRVNIVLAIWLLIGVILTAIFLMLSTRVFVKRWIIFTSVILYLFVVALIVILGGEKKIIEVLILCSLVFCLIPVKANAFGLIPQGTVLCTGTMDDGTSYTIYIDDLNIGNDSINIVHSKRFSIHVIFEGNIIPPSTLPVNITDDNIDYSGNLYLDSYESENFLGDKSTIAFYSGTLHALL